MILRGLGEVHILEIRKQIGGKLGIVVNLGDFGDPGIRLCRRSVSKRKTRRGSAGRFYKLDQGQKWR